MRPRGFRGFAAVADQRLDQLFANGQHRIERRHRLLKNHRQLVTAQIRHPGWPQFKQVTSLKQDFTAINTGGLRG
ncbi:hypothetical protein D3C80_2081170 [compost metagenome]